jgi:hypothetical protein
MHCDVLHKLQESLVVAVEEQMEQIRRTRRAFDQGPEPWRQELARLEAAERKVVDLWSAFLDHREQHGCELASRWLGYTA